MKKYFHRFLFIFCYWSCTRSNKPADNSTVVLKTAVFHCAPQTSDKDWYSGGTKAPLFKGLEGLNFNISTTNKETQACFNQGLMLECKKQV
jgi:hypothetical protein